jgi:hypothetical protein
LTHQQWSQLLYPSQHQSMLNLRVVLVLEQVVQKPYRLK